MSVKKRGGYVFVSYIGDHAPPHVHVYKDSRFVCKWDLQNRKVMEGKAPSRRLVKYIEELFGGAQVENQKDKNRNH